MTGRTRVVFATLGIGGTFAALSVVGLATPVLAPLRTALSPLVAAVSSGAGASAEWLTRAPWTLSGENKRLRAQVRALEQENSVLATRAQETRSLSELEAALGPFQLPTVTARVLARSPDPAAQLLTVDRGRSDGLKSGNAVLSSGGFLIGRIRQLDEHTSQVLAITDPGSRITVTVRNGSDPPGVLIGDRGRLARLTNVPRGSPIEVGQGVITAGIDGGVPRGLPVGSVADVTTKSADLFQTGTVLLAGNLDRLVLVSVVILKS